MSESRIRINQPGTGSFLKTFQSVDGSAATVEAQAVVLTDDDGHEVESFDLDTGGGTQFVAGSNLRRSAAGGSEELLGQTTMAKSLPVTMASDQTTLPVAPTASLATGSLGALNAVVTLTIGNGNLGAGFRFFGAAAFLGTVSAEQSDDGGTTWTVAIFAGSVLTIVGGVTTPASITNATTEYGAIMYEPGATHVRVRVSAYTGGSVSCRLTGNTTDAATSIRLALGENSFALPGMVVLVGGSDNSNTRTLKVDTSGRPIVVGASPAAAAITGNPVQIGTSDGTNVQLPRVFDLDTGGGTQYSFGVSLRKAASGGSVELGTTTDPVAVAGTAAAGAAVAGNPVQVGGSDGANARALLTDTSGRQRVVGAAADGAVVAGDPVLVAGQDGTNVQSLRTDTVGRIELGGTSTLTNGAETAVSNVAIEVLASNANRKSAIIQNTGTANIRVGVSAVTAVTGAQLEPGDSVRLSVPFVFTGAVFAIREGGSDSIAFAMEET